MFKIDELGKCNYRMEKMHKQGSKEQIPLIGVILPVYNREDHISIAVNSVIGQTEKDWELIIVDDGSTDSTGVICDAYAKLDSRIHVLHTKNQGVSIARNAGLHESKAKWIVFLDSDDVYDPEAFHIMLDHSDGMDLVAASMYLNKPGKECILTEKKTHYRDWKETIDRDFHKLYVGFFYSSVCAKLYRRHVITEEFNPELPCGEDVQFNLMIFPGLSNICVLPDVVYEYRYDPEISSGRNLKMSQLSAQRRVLDSWKSLLFPHYEKELAEVFRGYIEFLLVFIVKMTRQKELQLAYCQELLSLQLNIILVDERFYGINRLPAGHQAFWQLLREKKLETIFNCLDTLVNACFGKPLVVYPF